MKKKKPNCILDWIFGLFDKQISGLSNPVPVPYIKEDGLLYDRTSVASQVKSFAPLPKGKPLD